MTEDFSILTQTSVTRADLQQFVRVCVNNFSDRQTKIIDCDSFDRLRSAGALVRYGAYWGEEVENEEGQTSVRCTLNEAAWRIALHISS